MLALCVPKPKRQMNLLQNLEFSAWSRFWRTVLAWCFSIHKTYIFEKHSCELLWIVLSLGFVLLSSYQPNVMNSQVSFSNFYADAANMSHDMNVKLENGDAEFTV